MNLYMPTELTKKTVSLADIFLRLFFGMPSKLAGLEGFSYVCSVYRKDYPAAYMRPGVTSGQQISSHSLH